MAQVVLECVSKTYPNGVRAVRDLNLTIADGELIVLVGPSGCGKTTTLRLIAGLETLTSGTIRIGGRVVNGEPPHRRDIAMVFQRPALYPHLNVRQNLGFGLTLRDGGWPWASRARLTERRTLLHIPRSCWSCPTCLIDALASFPAVSNSASLWGALWRASRLCFCWMSRSATLMRAFAWKCAASCSCSIVV
jgi:ABC-type sugar transport system ATPase subunit